jgi:UTP--glucose-1-phosphate uridylyltransferase
MTAVHGSLRVVIPAAGLGTRFLPLTRVVPKELLLLGEWPLIHHALLEAARAQFSEAIIVISPRKRSIRSYFEGDTVLERALQARGLAGAVERLQAAQAIAHQVHLRFIEKETNGPGEAVLLAQRLTGDGAFGVLLPDDVVPSALPWHQLATLHQETGVATLSVRAFPPDQAGRYGVAMCSRENGRLRIRQLVEKPRPGAVVSPYRVFGRYIVTPPILAALAARRKRGAGELQLTDAYAACLDHRGGVFAAEFSGETFDCGTPDEYTRSVARYALRADAQEPAATGGRQ